MRRVVVLIGATVLLAAASCGGEEEAARAPANESAGVAGCWKDAAATAKDAADEAGVVLPVEIARARSEYANLRSAAARGDTVGFRTAQGAFFEALRRMNAGGDRFEPKQQRAGASLAACANEDPQAHAVDACWRGVASTYGESIVEADRALGPLGGTLYMMVQRLTNVLENGESDAVMRAEGRFFSAALRVQQAADRYAASHARGDELYEECAAA